MPYQASARRSAYAAYGLIASGGSVLAMSPVASLDDYGPAWAVVLWHGSLVLGAALSMFGVRTRRVTWQRVGAFLAGGILVTYSGVVLTLGVTTPDLSRVGFGVLFLSLPACLAALTFDALQVDHLQRELAQRIQEDQ